MCINKEYSLCLFLKTTCETTAKTDSSVSPLFARNFHQKYPQLNHNCVCRTMRVLTNSSLSYSAHESRDKMVSDIKKISYLAMSNAACTAHLGQPWQETSRHRCMCTWVRCAKTLHCAVCRMLSDGRAWNPVKRLRRTSFDAMSLI